MYKFIYIQFCNLCILQYIYISIYDRLILIMRPLLKVTVFYNMRRVLWIAVLIKSRIRLAKCNCQLEVIFITIISLKTELKADSLYDLLN